LIGLVSAVSILTGSPVTVESPLAPVLIGLESASSIAAGSVVVDFSPSLLQPVSVKQQKEKIPHTVYSWMVLKKQILHLIEKF